MDLYWKIATAEAGGGHGSSFRGIDILKAGHFETGILNIDIQSVRVLPDGKVLPGLRRGPAGGNPPRKGPLRGHCGPRQRQDSCTDQAGLLPDPRPWRRSPQHPCDDLFPRRRLGDEKAVHPGTRGRGGCRLRDLPLRFLQDPAGIFGRRAPDHQPGGKVQIPAASLRPAAGQALSPGPDPGRAPAPDQPQQKRPALSTALASRSDPGL